MYDNFLDAFLAKLAQLEAEAGIEEKGESSEIQKLDRLLTEADIPHEFMGRPFIGGHQVIYYGHKGKPAPKPGRIAGPGVGAVCSAIEGPGTYGYEDDRIEISGLAKGGVTGGLTAEEVFSLIKKHWDEEQPA